MWYASADDAGALHLQGIPPQFRGDQWFVISGAAARAAEKGPHYFRTMVELGRSSSTDRQQIQTVSRLRYSTIDDSDAAHVVKSVICFGSWT